MHLYIQVLLSRYKLTRSMQVWEKAPLVRVMEAVMINMVVPLRTRSGTRTVSHSSDIHDMDVTFFCAWKLHTAT